MNWLEIFFGVWDDFHRANDNDVFYTIFGGFIEYLYHDSQCFAISREKPPKEFSTRIVDLGCYQVNLQDLQFSKAEAVELLVINQVNCAG